MNAYHYAVKVSAGRFRVIRALGQTDLEVVYDFLPTVGIAVALAMRKNLEL